MIQHLLIDQDNCLFIRSSVRYILKIWAVDHPIKEESISPNVLRQIMCYNEERLARKIGADIISDVSKESQDE